MSFRAERSRSPRSGGGSSSGGRGDRGDRGRGDRGSSRSRSPRAGRRSRSPRKKGKGGRRERRKGKKRRGNHKRDKDGIYWYKDCTERESHRRRKMKQENSGASKSGGSGSGGGSTARGSGGREKNNDDDSPILGDIHLDGEGKVPDRTDKEHEQMAAGGDDSYSAAGGNDAQDGVGDVFGKLETPQKKKRHRMEKKAWNTVATKGAPDNARDASNQPINSTLYLEHVHGFRGQDVRNNLYYAVDGTMVYIAAALGICVDPITRKQRYMGSHTDDVISIALTPDKSNRFSVVATGEIGRNPKIIVWKSSTMEVLTIIKDCHKRGVCRVEFSPSGTILASVGIDDQNSLALHDWRSGDELAKVRTGGDKVFGLAYHPTNDGSLVTCGHNHMTFWTRTDRGLDDVSAKFGSGLAGGVSVLDTCYDATGRCFAATSLGHLGVFATSTGKSKAMLGLGKGSIENAHDGAINCVEVVPGGAHIVSGGKDGKIRVWDCSIATVSQIAEFKFPAQIPSVQSLSVLGSLTSASCCALVGTRGGDVLEISLRNGKRLKEKPVVTGHNYGELWGLVCHPSNPNVFITSGDDKTVRMWHIGSRECVTMAKSGTLPDMSRCLAYTSDAKTVAVGLGGRLGKRKTGDMGKHAGKVAILDGGTLKHLATYKVAKEQISDICYSNDGKTLAIASNDNYVYVCEARGSRLGLRSRCRGHSSFVTDISISKDDKFLMSNDGAGEILFWEVQTGKRVTRTAKYKNLQWAPNTCPLSWMTKGVWPYSSDLTDVNAVEFPADCNLGVAADDFGKIRLYNSPSMSWGAPSIVHRGHSAHVTNCCFSCDRSRVISVGGGDRCAFVWKVVTTGGGGGGGGGGGSGDGQDWQDDY